MSSEPYDIKPTEADLNDESLFSIHTGEMGCRKCETVGAHAWFTACSCCGKPQSRFDDESDEAFD